MQTKKEAEGATTIMLQQYCEIPLSSWTVRYTAQPYPFSPALRHLAYVCLCMCASLVTRHRRLRSIHLISMVDETSHGSPVKMA